VEKGLRNFIGVKAFRNMFALTAGGIERKKEVEA